jgi:hypothetical protein
LHVGKYTERVEKAMEQKVEMARNGVKAPGRSVTLRETDFAGSSSIS